MDKIPFWLGLVYSCAPRQMMQQVRNRWRLELVVASVAIICFAIGFFFGSISGSKEIGGYFTPARTHAHTMANLSNAMTTKTTQAIPWIEPLRTRNDIGGYLERQGFKMGAELGVQRGEFAEITLKNWPSCEKYYLVDTWSRMKNYRDRANVNYDEQARLYQRTKLNMLPWSDKVVIYRNFTTDAVKYFKDEELDYVYVDARHDYCGVLSDMELYWPKVKPGGLMAGHDYKDNWEAPHGEDWSLCANGTRIPGSVFLAVNEFSQRMGLQVVITYRDDWNSWLLRKPREL